MTHSLDDALVEKVARAIAGVIFETGWDALAEDTRACFFPYARAALEAAGVAGLREEIERLREALAVDETPTGGLHLPKWEFDARAVSAILAADAPLSRAGRDYAGKVLESLYEKVKNARSALTNQGKAQG